MAPIVVAIGRGSAAGVVKSAGKWTECGVMRNLIILAGVLIGLGTSMAEIADRITPARAHSSERNTTLASVVPQSGGRSLSIPRDARGHFETTGHIDGQRISFMVDTGASVIALNQTSAARFGLRPSRGDYNATVTTANGIVKGARARLAMIDIGGLVARDVDAMVLPDEALSENLLGLSFLAKLKRFEYSGGTLVLEQ
jgi:aspartyl protease family protein